MLEKAIKHFESLQKRYTTQHNGKMCEYVAIALEAMKKQHPTLSWYDAKYLTKLFGKSYTCPICRAQSIGQPNYCSSCGTKLKKTIEGEHNALI